MMRYADPYACPDCRSPLPPDSVGCPRCALPLRGPLATDLLSTLQRADSILDQLRASRISVGSPASAPSMTAGLPTAPLLPAAPPRRTGLRTASVPKILLSLGAVCLLVAAVIFLAVAWSVLGVGGRTAVLVTLTLLAGGVGTWLGTRGLRLAAESLTTVSLGLLALDVIGADNAGWLGDLSVSALTCAVGGTVGFAALALALTPSRLVAAQVIATIG
ncbi:MAG: hypothetical protein WKF50_13890, partial [Nocardioides sp.]